MSIAPEIINQREQLDSAAAPNYPALFRRRVDQTPERVAYLVPPAIDGGQWQEITWAEAKDQVDLIGAGFIALGLETEQLVAIISSTRIEWIFADLGIACAGGATTTVYPNTQADEEFYILNDSGVQIAVVENAKQLEKITSQPRLDEQITKIIIIDDDRTPNQRDENGTRVITWQHLINLGSVQIVEQSDCLDKAIEKLNPDSLSTLIYTSGTTGTPKGVELVHRNWTHEGEALNQVFGHLMSPSDNMYLWLPLSHVFGRDLIALHIAVGMQASVDGRVHKLMQNLVEVKPTVLVGVPRIFEKVRSAVMTMNAPNGIKGRISRWAFAVGRRALKYKMAGEKVPPILRAQRNIADRLVFSKLRAKLGGRMRFMISGSAKLSAQVQEWFYRAGIAIVEGYGATETAAVAFVNTPDESVLGSIGKPIPGLAVKLGAGGEILLNGPTIARGYRGLKEQSEESFVDGWYHTGDVGQWDANGFMRITDRMKDLFKTSNGKYAAPQKIENAIMANVPYVSQAVAVGEGRKFCSALVVLDPESLRKWGDRRGKGDLTYAELSQLPEIRESINRFIRRANTHLERWEQIKHYIILDRELTLDRGELTPSLKIKREVVHKTFEKEIDALYENPIRSDLTTE